MVRVDGGDIVCEVIVSEGGDVMERRSSVVVGVVGGCGGVVALMVGSCRCSMRSTAEGKKTGVVRGVSGGLAGGRAPLGPDPTNQLPPPRMLSRKVLNAAALSAGTSSAVT